MKLGTILTLFPTALLFNGCSHIEKQSAETRHGGDLSLQKSPAETLLDCLQDHWDLSRKDYKIALKNAQKNHSSQKSEYNQLQLICLNIHPSARYSQFRDGIQQLSQYTEKHPQEQAGLTGLKYLLELIDRERILRWNLSSKYDAETKKLLERNQQLQKETEQEKERLKELNKQIDQLKNIETIIKNREY